MLRSSPNHRTLALHNDDDDEEEQDNGYLSLTFTTYEFVRPKICILFISPREPDAPHRPEVHVVDSSFG